MRYSRTTLALLLGLLFALMAFNIYARTGPWGQQGDVGPRARPQVMQPVTDDKTHDVGQLFLTVSNWGSFGSGRGDGTDPDCKKWESGENAGECRPSGEYPGGSGIEYLFMGALWVGAVVDGDTLVSVGEDGWFRNVNELFPGYNQSTDTIMEYSIMSGDDNAISEQDYVGELTDTVKNPDFVQAEHRPIGIKIKQRSLSWSYNYARNFVIFDYWFTNVREDNATIEDVYIGIYIDGDCGHIDTDEYAQDDITGFLESFEDDINDSTIYVNTAWLADNDGDPTDDGRFDEYSPTGALGVAVLKVDTIPLENLDYSFNWWVSNSNEDLDWGPYLRRNNFGWDGTPETDKTKYQVMSNREFDYDQVTIVDYTDDPDWAPPPEDPVDLGEALRGGYDTRFLFSFGPFTVRADDTIQVGLAVMVAENFHVDPRNVGMPPNGSIPDGWDPTKFQFTEVGRSTQWVRDVYDNPPADGIPDYKGPVPPPRPDFFVESEENEIDIFWEVETARDFIDDVTGLQDFEGFRVYTGQANLESYYTPIIEFDEVDFIDYQLSGQRSDIFPLCLDARWDESAEVYRNYLVNPDSCLDTVYSYAGSTAVESTFVRKAYGTNSGMPVDSVMIDGKQYCKYTLTDQRAGADIYIAVTAYDFGQPTRKLESLESSKTTNYLWVVPKGEQVGDEKVYVVPNPYRVDQNYAGKEGLDWETPVGRVWTEYSRKIRFANLPARCVIRIYTLDGDLVKEIEHEDPAVGSSGGQMVGAEDWDLINRNDQAISSGIYMFSVEDLDSGEYELGKFVIIK